MSIQEPTDKEDKMMMPMRHNDNGPTFLWFTVRQDDEQSRLHNGTSHLTKLLFRHSACSPQLPLIFPAGPPPSFPHVVGGNPEHRCACTMEYPSPTSQKTAGFESRNNLRMSIGINSEDDRSSRLSGIMIPSRACTRKTDKGTRGSSASGNMQCAWTMKSSGVMTEKVLRLKNGSRWPEDGMRKLAVIVSRILQSSHSKRFQLRRPLAQSMTNHVV